MKFFLLSFLVSTVMFAASVPSLSLKNQYGEISNNFVIGGSSAITVRFVVDSTKASGVRELSSSGGPDAVDSVYMNTSTTPTSGSPNPSPGYIVVNLKKGYTGYLSSAVSLGAPGDSSVVNVTSGLQQGKAYVIRQVGTTSASQWQSLGLPSNLTPTASAPFIAVTGTPATGTGQVVLAKVTGSALSHLEVVGDPSIGLQSTSGGSQVILMSLAPTNSSTTTLVPTAPLAGSMIELSFVLTPQPESQL